MGMIWASVNVQLFDACTGKLGLRQHPLDSFLKYALREAAFENFTCGDALNAARVAGVAIIGFVFTLVVPVMATFSALMTTM